MASDKKLWLMDAAERDQLKCLEVLEAMNLDVIQQKLAVVAQFVLQEHNGRVIRHPALDLVNQVRDNVERFIICRDEARETPVQAQHGECRLATPDETVERAPRIETRPLASDELAETRDAQASSPPTRPLFRLHEVDCRVRNQFRFSDTLEILSLDQAYGATIAVLSLHLDPSNKERIEAARVGAHKLHDFVSDLLACRQDHREFNAKEAMSKALEAFAAIGKKEFGTTEFESILASPCEEQPTESMIQFNGAVKTKDGRTKFFKVFVSK